MKLQNIDILSKDEMEDLLKTFESPFETLLGFGGSWYTLVEGKLELSIKGCEELKDALKKGRKNKIITVFEGTWKCPVCGQRLYIYSSVIEDLHSKLECSQMAEFGLNLVKQNNPGGCPNGCEN